MNLTITPLNNQYSNNYKRYGNTFRGKENLAQEVYNAGTKDSGFFKPFTKKYDAFTNWLAQKFTKKYVESAPIEYLADKFKNSKNLFQHTMTVGSVITSGLYMQRTYTNDKLEKDRRNTLVVNQGLTLAVSTAGAYLLDKYLNGWWDSVTAKFAGHLLGDKDFHKNYLNEKEALKKQDKGLTDFIKANNNYKNLATKAEKDILMKKVKGMGPMKTMIVFGFVYRYFVPVVVTKPANKLCDMYLEHKKKAQTAKS